MPTEKPRITFTLSAEELDALGRFMSANGITNQSKAIRAIMSLGFDEIKKSMTSKDYNRFNLSPDAAQFIDDYESLSSSGKKVMHMSMDAAVILFANQPAPTVVQDFDSPTARKPFFERVLDEISKTVDAGS